MAALATPIIPASNSLTGVIVSKKLPLTTLANCPLLSILLANPSAFSCNNVKMPFCFWSWVFSLSIFLRTFSWLSSSSSWSANNSCCLSVNLLPNISLFASIWALLKAILSCSLAISFCVRVPEVSFADKLIRFSVDFTADLRSATRPLWTVFPTISTPSVKSWALSTASSKDATNLSPIEVTASRMNPNSSLSPLVFS